jgi:hypothetical protein
MAKILLLLLMAAAVLCAQTPDTSSEILGVFQFENTLKDSQFNEFHLYLSGKLGKELSAGLILKAWPLPFNDFFKNDTAKRQNIRIALFGRFEYGRDNTPTLNFKIMDLKAGASQEKLIAVNYMEKEDIAQIVMLKLKNFLEQSMLGRLNITSLPLGLPIALDQKPAGVTPKEFFLKSGAYAVEVTGQYLVPYREEIEMVPGKTVNLKAAMEFKGYPTSLWFLCASAATWELMVIWVLENGLHDDYLTSANKDDAFERYQNTRYLRYGILGVAGMGWIGTGFCYFSNKNLKKRYFNKIN